MDELNRLAGNADIEMADEVLDAVAGGNGPGEDDDTVGHRCPTYMPPFKFFGKGFPG